MEQAAAMHMEDLSAPAAASLTTRLSAHQPDLPPLITVEQWAEALNAAHSMVSER